MARAGYKFTPEQLERLSKSHMGQPAWNKGTGGCKKGHDPELYVQLPSGAWYCKGCRHENSAKYRQKNRELINLKNRVGRYGISIENYQRLVDIQSGKCAICKMPLNKNNIRIDHDHSTGEIRGILCISCNTGIGLLKDAPEILISAAKYIRSYKRKNNENG